MDRAEYSLAGVEHELRCVGEYLNRITAQQPRTRHTQQAINAATGRLTELRRKRASIVARIEQRKAAS